MIQFFLSDPIKEDESAASGLLDSSSGVVSALLVGDCVLHGNAPFKSVGLVGLLISAWPPRHADP